MKKKLLLVSFLSVAFLVAPQAADLPLTNGTRIVFAGNSIQELSMCPHYMAAYLILRNPSLMLHCQTEARGGLNLEGWLDPSGLSYSHYSRRVSSYEPDFFFISTSTNGGFTKQRHKDAMTTLVRDYAMAQGAKVIMHGTTPACSTTGLPIIGEYDNADEEIALAETPALLYHKSWWALKDKWTECHTVTANAGTDVFTADNHGFADGQPVIFLLSANPVGPTGVSSNTRYYLRDVTASTFKVSTTNGGAAANILTNGSGTSYVSNTWPLCRREERQDDDHTGQAGNIAYAWKIITGLGWGTDVSQSVINGASATLTSQSHCTVTGVSANAQGGVDFMRLDGRLPWAIDEEGRAGAEFLYPSLRGWQNYSLTVTGLAAGNYDILCDGETIGTATHTALAAGWNMADLAKGPIWRQCQEVLGRVRDMHDRARAYPFATLHIGTARVGVEKYRGAVDYAYATLGLRGSALIADATVRASLHRNLRAVTSVDASTNVITHSSHGYQDGQKLRINSTGVLPSPLAADTDYYVRDKSVVGYKFAASSGGSAIDLTTAGNGTISVYTMDNIDDLDALIHAAAQPTTHSFSIRIQGTAPSNDATVFLGGLTQTYDGTAKAATATTSPAGLTVALTYNGSTVAPTNAGSYTVVGTISELNYTGSATGTLVITKANATVTLGNLAQTYDGAAKAATATTSPAGLTVALTYNGSTVAPTSAGSYTVVGTISDVNYTGSATGTLVIAKANATVTLSNLAQSYDGTVKAATATTSPSGMTVAFTYNGSSVAPTTAGSYTVVGTISDVNYTGTATGTLVIADAKLNATITLGNLAQAYDGAAKEATAITSPIGLTVALTYNGSATAPTSAGSYTVVGTISDLNYTGSATGTLVIAAGATTGYVPPLGIPVPRWGSLDPINMSPPAHPSGWPAAVAAGCYYIDNTAPGATDTSNAYGYPAKPRLTIPEILYAAGSYVEIHGGPYTHSWGDADWDMSFAGTEANPCWVTGTSETVRPELRGQLKISGSYAIIQWLQNNYDTANSRGNSTMIGGDPKLADHICLRSCSLAGDGVRHAGFGTNLQIVGTSATSETNHIVIFDVESKDADNFDYVKTTAEDDNHGAQVGFYTNNIWFLKFKSHNNAGDGMQVSGNNALGEARVQRLFIGDSEFYHNAENSGIDMKSSLDVIISHNRIGDCTWSTGGGGGSLCITQDEGGDGCDNIWVIFNEMYDAVNPLRVEERSTNVYLLGNVIRNMSDLTPQATYIEDGYSGFVVRSNNLCTPRVIDNTFVNMASGGLRWKAVGTPPQLRVHGNIFALRTNPTGWDIWGQGQDAGVLLDYTLYDSTAPRMFFSNTYTSLSAWIIGNPRGWDAHSRSAAPGFTNAAGNDYSLQAGSAAVDASIEDPAYAAFEARYGINIRQDIAGTPRPQGKAWDIGAYEYSSKLLPPRPPRVSPLKD